MKYYLTKRFNEKKQEKVLAGSKKFFYLNALLLSCACVLFVGYLLQVNATASRGFALRDAELAIDTLHKEGRVLEVQIVDLQAMHYVQSKIISLGGFVENENTQVMYISGGVAIK